MATTKSYTEMRAELIDKAGQDQEFRARLIEDPKAAVKDALGVAVPDSVSLQVHQDSATVAHLVLPPSAALNVEDLDAIAAGDPSNYGELKHRHGPQGEMH